MELGYKSGQSGAQAGSYHCTPQPKIGSACLVLSALNLNQLHFPAGLTPCLTTPGPAGLGERVTGQGSPQLPFHLQSHLKFPSISSMSYPGVCFLRPPCDEREDGEKRMGLAQIPSPQPGFHMAEQELWSRRTQRRALR